MQEQATTIAIAIVGSVILHPEDGQPERARVITADNQTGSYLVYLLDQGFIQTILPEQEEIHIFCIALPL